MTTQTQKSMSLPAACLDYFGKKPLQSSMEFMAEFKALTDKDKADLREMFPTVGYTIQHTV